MKPSKNDGAKHERKRTAKGQEVSSPGPAQLVLVADIIRNSLQRAYSIPKAVHTQLEILATDKA